jgi:Beta-propeller repeat
LAFYGRDRDLEFDWIVAPGVDPSQITMAYAGMDSLSLDAEGNLVIAAAGEQLVQHAPVVYQVIAGERQEIASSYRLGATGTVSFALGAYDANVPLVIDPHLAYSTYLGKNRNEYVSDIATDSQGNTYVVGTTQSANLTLSDVNNANGIDRGFLTKYLPDGQNDYTTILGPRSNLGPSGYATSQGYAVVIGPDDLLVVSFETTETATIQLQGGAYLPLPGTTVLHVAKVAADGVLIPEFDTIAPVLETEGFFQTFSFYGVHLAADETGATYVTYTAVRATAGGGITPNSFISKLDSSGNVAFTRYNFGFASGIAVDKQHHVYVALSTSRDDLPVTLNAFQPVKLPIPADLSTDVWVAELNPEITGVVASTYFGGSRNDYVYSLAVNPAEPGLVYIAGATESEDFHLKNPFQQRPVNGTAARSESYTNGFISLLDLNATSEHPERELVASTYFGGSRGDYLQDIALDDLA